MADETVKPKVEPKVMKIPLDMEGKQILLVHGVPDEVMHRMANQIEEWMQSNRPVFIINLAPGVDIEYIRVGAAKRGKRRIQNKIPVQPGKE